MLRHTAITAVGRLAGYPVAQAFAGHAPPSVTGTYLHATIDDVATAIAALTGLPHPLARQDNQRGGRCERHRLRPPPDGAGSAGPGALQASTDGRLDETV